MSKGKEFPPRVREVISCSGLRVDFFAVDSNAFRHAELHPLTNDLCREYVSLLEVEHLVSEARERFDREHLLMKQQLENAMKALEKALLMTPQTIVIEAKAAEGAIDG